MFSHLLHHHTKLEKQLERSGGEPIEALPIPVRELHDPAACPAHLLPWLAWERSVDYWRDDWSEQVKRDVIAASVAVHRKKGTAFAIRAALGSICANPDITRQRVPHTFSVTLDSHRNAAMWALDATDLAAIIADVKPARCGYTLAYKQHATTGVGIASSGQVTTHQRTDAKHLRTAIRATTSAGVGIASSQHITTHLRLEVSL